MTYYIGGIIMSNEERDIKIDEFIEKWNEMLSIATSIEGFEWKFSVTITSDVSLDDARLKTIDGINSGFTRNSMSYECKRNY